MYILSYRYTQNNKTDNNIFISHLSEFQYNEYYTYT